MLSVGIDIGSYSVKVVEIFAQSKSFQVHKFEEYLLSQDPNKDQKLEIVEILRDIAAKYDPENTRFVFGLSEQKVSSRHINFPFKERHKILKSIGFELEDLIPLSIDDSILDARVLRYVNKTADTIAIACPKENIEENVQLAKDGKINLNILSVKTFALANVFGDWKESPLEIEDPSLLEDEEGEQITHPPQDAKIILNFGHDSTQLLVFIKDTLITTKNIDWGGRHIAHEMAHKYSMQYVETIKELRKKGFILTNNDGATQEEVVLSDTIKSSINKFTDRLKLALLGIQSEHNLKFSEIQYCGGLSGIKNIGAFLTQKLEIPSNKILRLALLPNIDIKNSPNNEISGLTALGLALEGIRKPKNPSINLLKDEFAIQSQNFKRLLDKWSYSLKVLAAIFIVFLVFSILRDSFSENLKFETTANLKKNARKIANLKGSGIKNKIKKYIRAQKKREQAHKSLEGLQDYSSALDILRSISNLKPAKSVANFNIKHFEVTNTNIILEGNSSSKQGITTLQNALKKIAQGGKVNRVPATYKSQAPWTPFRFQFKVNRFTDGQ